MKSFILKFRTIVMKAAIACGLIIGFSSQVWATEQGAKKELLIGPLANIYCYDLAPYPGEVSDQIQDGFVIFNYDDESGILMATVKLKGAEPDTDYPVRLIQNGYNGCWMVDGILSTNRMGNGVLHIEEPGVGSAAQIFIDTRYIFIDPTWRATDIFYYHP
ncbi:MAG: hypothetical protein OEY96_08895 [Gammaproteobacteria bacterium]|nr:hypothetical protein [Gammaproteobacteria bacterium]